MDDEANLGLYVNGSFGLDSVSLGLPGSKLPVVDDQLIVGIISESVHVASLGICPIATNLSNYDHPAPTMLTILKQQQLVLSLSWAYTAGSFYEHQSRFPEFGMSSAEGNSQQAKRCQPLFWWV